MPDEFIDGENSHEIEEKMEVSIPALFIGDKLYIAGEDLEKFKTEEDLKWLVTKLKELAISSL